MHFRKLLWIVLILCSAPSPVRMQEAILVRPTAQHLAFQSDRTGSPQIYIMLLDGSEIRMVTAQGANTSPAWSGYQKTLH